ncbi:CCAAT/enhancer-binding protein zeta [Copidosoma floridanum]|uniref:CCAAT/enhancer-binding protein zeta n=1 Tax=Copidosoma floridanum TaxID=29053 RepID=UPI0006C99927|nr:CCAAT/enhancer-binding protein zeta [Copidosoma floridanum]XP_014218701.1 CCAAT/enhancer-binding protein zeta [Copidosoma floridanum]
MNHMDLEDGPRPKYKKWYEEFTKTEGPKKHNKSDMDVINLKEEAKKCLDSESAAYHLKQSKTKNSDYFWMKTALSKGTIADRVAAGIVLVQDSPKHNLNHLNSLMSQVKVAKHNQCSKIITDLKDLFLCDLLHPQYKLVKFEDQDLNLLDSHELGMSKNKILALWYFEDQLKEIYDGFVNSLSKIANDTVDLNREKAVTVMNDLLMGNPEQEHNLLAFLINKVGDPSSKVASKAVFCLTKLLHEHPQMKLIVLKEVEKLLFRTNISPRAQYFAICLLTQFLLTKEDTQVATTLIDVYFAFFKACLKKGEPDSRMMAAILAGVNRAYRFADVNTIKLSDHIDSVYKVVHHGTFNVSLNALSLLFQVVGKDPKQSDRFYMAFYKKLIDPQIGTANKRAIFLNLFYRVLRNDQSILRLHAFIKRILQASISFPANMICATLYTLSQVLKSRKFTNKILTRSAATVKNDDGEIDLSKTMDEVTVQEKKTKTKTKENTVVLSNVISKAVEEENKEDDDVKPVVEVKNEFKATFYDPFNRNPLRSGANLNFYSELGALARHFHPSVSLFASTIVASKPIEYTGDPLEDLSLIRFLDRYVFKNPKKLEGKKVSRKNDPLAHRTGYAPKGVRLIPVDSPAYIAEKQDRIPVDELFLYQYMQKRGEIKVKQEEDDNESVNSEDFNDMLDQLSKSKKLEDIDDFDVAGDISRKPKKSKVSNDEGEEGDDELDDEDAEISDEDMENSDMEMGEFDEDDDGEFEDLDDMDLDDLDDDMSDIEFNEDDDDDDNDVGSKQSSKKRKQNKGSSINKKFKISDENPFVSAEEFAEMLENQGKTKFKHGASKSFSDRDGANAKQLDWESERNQRLAGFRGKKQKKPFKNFKGSKKNFSKQKLMKRKK